MALFVANTTKQTFEFNYWVAENKKYFTAIIRPGAQESIYPQGSREDHERIIEQHKVYGVIPVSEVDRTKEFIGQCYQFDKPIPLDRLQATFSHNDDAMMRASQERRKEATLSMDDMLNRSAQEADVNLQNFEVQVIENEQKGVDTQINEKIVVENTSGRGRGRPRRS